MSSKNYQRQKEGFTINEENNSSAKSGKPWLSVVVIMSIVVSIGIMFMMMPKGFDMTHENIGRGTPALVFVYDPNLSVSISQSEQLNAAREKIGEQALFLVAKVGTPEGDTLIAKHRASSAELLLFDASGSLVDRVFALKYSDELVRWLTESRP